MATVASLLLKNAQEHSSALFVFDGYLALQQDAKFSDKHAHSVFKLETRAGSAAAIVGYLKQLSDKSSADVKPITLLLTPSSLLQVVLALQSFTGPRPPIVAHVALSEPHVETLERLPKVDTFLQATAVAPDSIVLLSGGSKNGTSDIINTLAAVQQLSAKGKDVIHGWEAIYAGQEVVFGSPTTVNGDAMEGVESSAAADGNVEALVKDALGEAKPFFEYIGPESPSKVIVLPSSVHSANALAVHVPSQTTGILTVRVVKPWSSAQLLAALPTSVKQVVVAAELYQEVYFAVSSERKIRIKNFALPSPAVWSVADWTKYILNLSGQATDGSIQAQPLLPATSKLAVFWSADEGKTSDLADRVATQFIAQGGVHVRQLKEFDNYNGKEGGLQRSILLLSPSDLPTADEYALPAIVETSAPSLLFISSPTSVLPAYDPLVTIGKQTQTVFSSSSWAPEEYAEKLSVPNKNALTTRSDKKNVWTLDVSKVVADSGLIAADGLVEEAAFWQLYLHGASIAEANQRIANLLGTSPAGGEWSTTSFQRLVDLTRDGLKNVPLALKSEKSDVASLPAHIKNTSAGPNLLKDFPDVAPRAPKSWHHIAKQLLFKEAYETDVDALRPDLPEENFILTVTENKRLTPIDYDRNVFHLELSTKGTGLKYAVGEALGVHGWNDEAEVTDFIQWFGLDPNALVIMPGRTHAHLQGESRTVFQTLQQNLDIFGKPGKSFYEALSKVATDREESRHLRFISSAEGSATFKKWSDVDTVTYVDVLKAFPSTREKLGLEGLLREVPLIKPRHYSIASSQNFVGDSVHLLIVTVDWMTPAEVTRFGQCTRYLANLKPGAQVTVSVKPSVMKLPPRDEQPIIMAGLGTGAAPFRAFLQERQYQKERGIDVGPTYYYFGSRYSSKEFLYGEEIKAWLADGVLTHAGLAFSRDTRAKVYIQHKMQEDGQLLADALDDGVFYLCGPTWPVPDVHEALCSALIEHRGKTKEEAEARIEELKEAERYILEVY